MKKAKIDKEKVDARNHENLVDQFKLRKKTVTSRDIQAARQKMKAEQKAQVDNTRVIKRVRDDRRRTSTPLPALFARVCGICAPICAAFVHTSVRPLFTYVCV